MDSVPLQYTHCLKKPSSKLFSLVFDSAIYIVGTAEFARIVLTCKPSRYFRFGLRHRGHISR